MSKGDISIKEAFEKYTQFEERLSLFDLKVDEVLFWERIRFHVFKNIFTTKLMQEDKEEIISHQFPKRKIRNYVLKADYLFKSIFQLKKNPLLSKNSDILILSSSRRKKLSDGKWWDVFTDYFIEELEYSSVSIEGPFGFQYLKPAKTRNLLHFAYIDLLVLMKRIWGIGKIKLSSEEKVLLDKITEEISLLFKVRINIRKLVTDILTIRKRIKPYYISILRRIKPKIVLLVCSYGKEEFIETCREQNIPTIELQHGVITRFHPGYSFEGKKARKITFPDYLFTFGDYWKNSVTYPIDKKNILSVGHTELEILQKEYENKKKRKQILILSQPFVGHELSKFAAALSKEKNLDYEIIYKLHPGEYSNWKEIYPKLDKSTLKIVDHTGKNIHELFSESTIQIGVNSTAIYEGLSYGLKTMIFSAPGYEYMQYLIETENATKISSVKDFISSLSKTKSKEFDANLFFKRNSVKNISENIKKIIEGIK